MKKVLFATTALVFSAGIAAAEVSLSGTGRMGVVYTGDNKWAFNSRARVIFDLTGQTDNGLEFGGSFRADQAGNANKGGEGSVFISGAFGKLEMGDTLGAPEALFGDMPEVGYSDLTSADPTHGSIAGASGQGLLENDIPYLTGDSAATTSNNNPILLYTYSSGPIAVAASFSDGTNSVSDNAWGLTTDDAQEYAVAAAYTFDVYTVGLGYEVLDPVLGEKATQGTLAATATLGDVAVKAYYAWGNQSNPVDNAYGLGLSSKFGATTVVGYVQKVDLDKGVAFANGAEDVFWWGLGASYDLGGGASLVGGLSDNDLKGSDVTADFGVKFKF